MAERCSGCGRTNRAGARFCDCCGKPLGPRCPACNAQCSPDAQFCDACGAPLVAQPSHDAVARKVVTIVLADLIGSTSLQQRLDPESVSRAMDHCHRTVRVPVTFDADGFLGRWGQFDADRGNQAVARLDALVGAGPEAAP